MVLNVVGNIATDYDQAANQEDQDKYMGIRRWKEVRRWRRCRGRRRGRGSCVSDGGPVDGGRSHVRCG